MMKGLCVIYALGFVQYVEGWAGIFSRDLQLCGGGGDSGSPRARDCSSKVGDGECKSAEGQTYDWCKNTVADAAECRNAAEENPFAVAWEYYGESRTCYVLFDNALSDSDVLRFCPSGYATSNSGYTGTGYPAEVGTDGRYVCYSCKIPN